MLGSRWRAAIARAAGLSSYSRSSKASVKVWTGSLDGALRQVGHRGRVDAAGEEHARAARRWRGGAGRTPAAPRELLPRPIGAACGRAPASPRSGASPPSSAPLQDASLAGPEQLDAGHRRVGADHEPVPDHRGHRAADRAGGAEQARRRGGRGPPRRRRTTRRRPGPGSGRGRAASCPSGSRARTSRRREVSQKANANMPRKSPIASGPREASARSITAVSPVDAEPLAGRGQALAELARSCRPRRCKRGRRRSPGRCIGWAPDGERSRIERRRWASSTPQPLGSGIARRQVPSASGPRWTSARLIRRERGAVGARRSDR